MEHAPATIIDSLPPPEYRLWRPIDGRILTQVDDRGIVDVQRLIQDVKTTVDPSYDWGNLLDVHHFYWPAYNYPYAAQAKHANPYQFRNLPIHRGLIPKAFHRWLHVVTEPPAVPKENVMHYRIEAWSVASSLFKEARKNIQWQRLAKRRREFIVTHPEVLKEEFEGVDIEGEQVINEVFRRNFEGLESHRKRLNNIPEEFRLLNIEETPERLAAIVGRCVMHGSAKLINAVAS